MTIIHPLNPSTLNPQTIRQLRQVKIITHDNCNHIFPPPPPQRKLTNRQQHEPHSTILAHRRFESPLDPQAGCPARYENVQHCRGLSLVLLQLKDSLELFVKRRDLLPGSGFLSRRDMTLAVKSAVKPHSFPPLTPQYKLVNESLGNCYLSQPNTPTTACRIIQPPPLSKSLIVKFWENLLRNI